MFGKRTVGERVVDSRTPQANKVNRSSFQFKTNFQNFNSKLPSKIVAPLFVQKVNDNRPYISVKLFDQSITALLDSGANISVVGRPGLPILKYLGITTLQTSLKHVNTADGTKQNVQGIVNLPIVIKDTVQILPSYVVPSLSHSFIFGSDFCKKFKIKVDFRNNVWYAQDNLSSNVNVA